MAMTLDGKVALPDGKWYGLSSSGDRHRMDLYRMEADVLMVGRNSVENDDPVVVPRRSKTDRRRPPRPAMICRSSLPPGDRKMFQQKEALPLLFCAEELQGEAESFRDRAEIIVMPRSELNPANIVAWFEERGVEEMLVEGGPSMNHVYFRDDLVDVLYLTLVPFILGARSLPGIVNGADMFPDYDSREWMLGRAETIGEELFLRYVRVRDGLPAVR